YQAAVDDFDALEQTCAAVLADFGHVDILVHSAGIASRGNTIADTDPEEFERLFRVHTFAAFMLCKLLVPQMREQPRGNVILVSSAATTHMAANSSPYNIGKASMEALARTLAQG